MASAPSLSVPPRIDAKHAETAPAGFFLLSHGFPEHDQDSIAVFLLGQGLSGHKAQRPSMRTQTGRHSPPAPEPERYRDAPPSRRTAA